MVSFLSGAETAKAEEARANAVKAQHEVLLMRGKIAEIYDNMHRAHLTMSRKSKQQLLPPGKSN
jgi:hypothetical protein